MSMLLLNIFIHYYREVLVESSICFSGLYLSIDHIKDEYSEFLIITKFFGVKIMFFFRYFSLNM